MGDRAATVWWALVVIIRLRMGVLAVGAMISVSIFETDVFILLRDRVTALLAASKEGRREGRWKSRVTF